MLLRLRESLTIVLLALLPFHALFVTVGTKLMFGPGHAPLPMLAGWKEGLLTVILLIAALEFLRKPSFKIDLMDGLVVALFGIALVLPKTNFLFGFKYDFIPLVAFLVLRRAPWSAWFRSHAEGVLLATGGIIALYGIVTFFLPIGFFTELGYSDAHSLYLPDGPLAAFQQISGTGIRRIQSTMSGPNQLGIWLLTPIAILLARLGSEKLILRHAHFSLFTLLGIALFLTFSRSAWIAAFVISGVIGWSVLPKRFFAMGAGGVLLVVLAASLLFPPVFIRPISLTGHAERPLQALRMMMEYPLGLGLGSAGPAANRTHDPCVFLEQGSDPSWAQASPELCVFVGKMQVQPAGQQCDCPLLPENWYLQIGVELGIAGLLLYLVLIGTILWRLKKADAVFLLFLGISIAGLFLHSWEDAAVAYTGWVLIAGIIRPWFTPAPSSSSTSAGSTRT